MGIFTELHFVSFMLCASNEEETNKASNTIIKLRNVFGNTDVDIKPLKDTINVEIAHALGWIEQKKGIMHIQKEDSTGVSCVDIPLVLCDTISRL